MPKPIELIDEHAAQTLRFLLISRSNEIDKVYPEVGTPERMLALEKLIHLTHELGLDCEGLIYHEENN